MPRSPENRGTYAYYGEVATKRGVIKHLEKCSKRIEALQSAEVSNRPTETLWHLQIQDAYLKDFWLLSWKWSARPLSTSWIGTCAPSGVILQDAPLCPFIPQPRVP